MIRNTDKIPFNIMDSSIRIYLILRMSFVINIFIYVVILFGIWLRKLYSMPYRLKVLLINWI